MQEEFKKVNLRDIVDRYLEKEGYNHFPEIDLIILDHEQVRDFFNNSMRTIKLIDKIKHILDV